MNLEELISEAKRISEIGCTDGNCKFRGPTKGMHTNGGCRCTADPDQKNRTLYNDIRYMANLLGLIAVEYEHKQDKLKEIYESR